MEEERLRAAVGGNIAFYRKRAGMTQLELSERLNYSDKSVSKWERGEGLPDLTVLVRLAEVLGVSPGDLLDDSDKRNTADVRRDRRAFVTALSLGLVWLAAVLCFFIVSVFFPSVTGAWLIFVAAVPVCAVVAVVFTTLWWPWPLRLLSVSILIWGVSVTGHLLGLRAGIPNIWLIHAVAGILQVLAALWYLMRNSKK